MNKKHSSYVCEEEYAYYLKINIVERKRCKIREPFFIQLHCRGNIPSVIESDVAELFARKKFRDIVAAYPFCFRTRYAI